MEGVSTTRFHTGTSAEGSSSRNKHTRRSDREPVREQGVTCTHSKGKQWEDATSRALLLYKNNNTKPQYDLFERVHIKLQMLEEEMNHMKKTILGCVEERDMLINEITQQFHRIKKSLVSSEAVDGYKDGNRKMGLLEVLQRNAAPSCIIKDMRVNLNTFQDLISTS